MCCRAAVLWFVQLSMFPEQNFPFLHPPDPLSTVAWRIVWLHVVMAGYVTVTDKLQSLFTCARNGSDCQGNCWLAAGRSCLPCILCTVCVAAFWYTFTWMLGFFVLVSGNIAKQEISKILHSSYTFFTSPLKFYLANCWINRHQLLIFVSLIVME